jgi:hydrogenase maturation protease
MVYMRILLCGMGNTERGDDGFGPYIIRHLSTTSTVKTVDCGMHPENYLSKMISECPDVIVFLDTVSKQGCETVFLKDEEILEQSTLSVSTHNIPMSALYGYLKENCTARICFVGVRPLSYERMTEEVTTVAHRIIKYFDSLDNQKNINIIGIYENLSSTLR